MNGRPARQLPTALLLCLLCASAAPAAPDRGDGAPLHRWFSLDPVIETGGRTIDRLVIAGPPEPPAGAERPPADGARAAITIGVPAYIWSFGSSATAAAMIAAHHDRTVYPAIYTGQTNGGVMPMDNSVWPAWIDTNGDTQFQCPLSASHNGLDGRTTNGHVDDYWIYAGQQGPDPYDGNWAEHQPADCTGDFMKANKWFPAEGCNVDGGATFYSFSDGSRLTAADMEYYGVDAIDGGYGLKLFYESRGYDVNTMFNQYIQGLNGNTDGFGWSDYVAEIDAGRPVMVHLAGSTVVGIGYDDDGSRTMYIHDTWDFDTHTMTWGGTYAGMEHYGVTIVRLELTTLVELVTFGAKAAENRVLLQWETAAELDNAGFNLYRGEQKAGPLEQLNGPLIPPEGGVSWGAVYRFTDDEVSPGMTCRYVLEDVNLAGEATAHDPITVTVPALNFSGKTTDHVNEGQGGP